jgi:hypothetical protein
MFVAYAAVDVAGQCERALGATNGEQAYVNEREMESLTAPQFDH